MKKQTKSFLQLKKSRVSVLNQIKVDMLAGGSSATTGESVGCPNSMSSCRPMESSDPAVPCPFG